MRDRVVHCAVAFAGHHLHDGLFVDVSGDLAGFVVRVAAILGGYADAIILNITGDVDIARYIIIREGDGNIGGFKLEPDKIQLSIGRTALELLFHQGIRSYIGNDATNSVDLQLGIVFDGKLTDHTIDICFILAKDAPFTMSGLEAARVLRNMKYRE